MNPPPDRSTPERTLTELRNAAIAGDWPRLFFCLTLEAQRGLVGGLCLDAAYAAQGNLEAGATLSGLLDRYGLSGALARDWQGDELLEVLQALMAWAEGYLPEERRPNIGGALAQTRYGKMRIQGDRAYVISTFNERRNETRLRRIDGHWYVTTS